MRYLLVILIALFASISYAGNCDYTWQFDARGNPCGSRAACIRPGGRLGPYYNSKNKTYFYDDLCFSPIGASKVYKQRIEKLERTQKQILRKIKKIQNIENNSFRNKLKRFWLELSRK